MEELGTENINNNIIDEVEVTYTPSSDTEAPIINVKQKAYKIKRKKIF